VYKPATRLLKKTVQKATLKKNVAPAEAEAHLLRRKEVVVKNIQQLVKKNSC